MAKTINTTSTVTDLRAKSETLHATPPVATPDVGVKVTAVDPTLSVAPLGMSFKDMISAAMGGVELPSMTRVLIGAVVGIVTAGIATYAGIVLTNMFVAWALTMTTSSFLIFMSAFIGYALTIVAATMLGSKAQSLILGGGLETAMSSVRGYVGGMFSKSTAPVAAS